ncbi:MAG: hypothetical protein Q9N62_00280, partial [Ghiorsea sp.]|nr:hypothetical protein [Ghiorsea sp.]
MIKDAAMAKGALNGMGAMRGAHHTQVTNPIGIKARITAMVATIVGLPVSLVARTINFIFSAESFHTFMQ